MTDKIKLTNWLDRAHKIPLMEKSQDDLINFIFYQAERLDSYEKALKAILNKTQKSLK